MKKTQSAGGIVINRKGQVIVVKQGKDSWSLPKGHINEGETPLSAAKREIYEETGVKDLKLLRELGSYERHKISKNDREDKSELKTIFMFMFSTNQEELKPIDPKNPEAR